MVAVVRTGGTVFTSEVDEEVGEVDPFVLGDYFHEVLFDFYGVFVFCKA